MSVTNTIIRNSVFIKLHTGTSDKGVFIIKTLSLGALKTTAFNDGDYAKVLAITNALNPCFAYNPLGVQLFVTGELEED